MTFLTLYVANNPVPPEDLAERWIGGYSIGSVSRVYSKRSMVRGLLGAGGATRVLEYDLTIYPQVRLFPKCGIAYAKQ